MKVSQRAFLSKLIYACHRKRSHVVSRAVLRNPPPRNHSQHLHHTKAALLPLHYQRLDMTTKASPPATGPEQPWHAAYPEPRSNPESIERSKVLELLKEGKQSERFVLVDLRRTDHEVRPLVQPHSSGLRRSHSEQYRRVAPSKAPSTCLPRASTHQFPRYTLFSELPTFVESSGIVVCLLFNSFSKGEIAYACWHEGEYCGHDLQTDLMQAPLVVAALVQQRGLQTTSRNNQMEPCRVWCLKEGSKAGLLRRASTCSTFKSMMSLNIERSLLFARHRIPAVMMMPLVSDASFVRLLTHRQRVLPGCMP